MLVLWIVFLFFFFKQKTAYEMRISDWSSDVCSSDLLVEALVELLGLQRILEHDATEQFRCEVRNAGEVQYFAFRERIADRDRAMVVQADDVTRICFFDGLAISRHEHQRVRHPHHAVEPHAVNVHALAVRSEEHTSELQSLMRNSYAVFCLKKKN